MLIKSGSQRTGLDAVVWARRAEALGAGEILLTSFDRDGTRSGYVKSAGDKVYARVDPTHAHFFDNSSGNSLGVRL